MEKENIAEWKINYISKIYYTCGNCGIVSLVRRKFCPGCGFKMVTNDASLKYEREIDGRDE